jgi:hypothetical protein
MQSIFLIGRRLQSGAVTASQKSFWPQDNYKAGKNNQYYHCCFFCYKILKYKALSIHSINCILKKIKRKGQRDSIFLAGKISLQLFYFNATKYVTLKVKIKLMRTLIFSVQ